MPKFTVLLKRDPLFYGTRGDIVTECRPVEAESVVWAVKAAQDLIIAAEDIDPAIVASAGGGDQVLPCLYVFSGHPEDVTSEFDDPRAQILPPGRLEEARRRVAEATFERLVFGGYLVEDADEWSYDPAGNVWSRVVYLFTQDCSGIPSLPGTLTLTFAQKTAWVICGHARTYTGVIISDYDRQRDGDDPEWAGEVSTEDSSKVD